MCKKFEHMPTNYTMCTMNTDSLKQLEAMIQQRHLTLWARIVSVYEIEPSMNSQVRKWILQGKLTEKASKCRSK